MRPHYSLVSAPVTEPVSLDQALEHLRVDSSDDIAYVDALIPVAREFVESLTGRVCSLSTWRLTADSWAAALVGCGGGNVPLFRTPLVSITSIKYIGANSSDQTVMDAGDYISIPGYQPGMVHFPDNLPSLASRPDAVQIDFVAGHEDPELASPVLRHAIKLLVAHLYENRMPVAFASCNEIPFTLQSLINNQKLGGWVA